MAPARASGTVRRRAGCGDDRTDEQKIREMVPSYLTAVSYGDAETACKLFTDGGRRQLEEWLRSVGEPETCESHIHGYEIPTPDWTPENVRRARIISITFTGPRTAKVELTGGYDYPTVIPIDGSTLELEKSDDGDWRIAGPMGW